MLFKNSKIVCHFYLPFVVSEYSEGQTPVEAELDHVIPVGILGYVLLFKKYSHV